jgi:hypothetical protein
MLCSFYVSNAQIDKNSLSKWSLSAEMGVCPVKSTISETIYSVIGQMGVQYNYKHFVMIGAYGSTMFYHKNNDVPVIDTKIIDMNSIEYNTIGLSLGLRFRKWNLEVQPKLDVGYAFFVAKAVDYGVDRKSFLDYRYLTLNPKLYFGYCITPFTTLGLNVGYMTQKEVYKGKIISEFNPNGFNGSLFCSFFFRSKDYLPKKASTLDDKRKDENPSISIPFQ